jgi:hypothetical protein
VDSCWTFSLSAYIFRTPAVMRSFGGPANTVISSD